LSNLTECKEQIDQHILTISKELIPLKVVYNKLFIFDNILVSEHGGKTKLNRQTFNESNDLIQSKILIFLNELEACLDSVRETIKEILKEHNKLNYVDMNSLIFEDSNFMELLKMDLEAIILPASSKAKLLNNLSELFKLKNKIFNLKYLVSMFDTTIINKSLNKLGVEDLVNSTIIFELIDTYGLHMEELKNFEFKINDFYQESIKTKDISSLNYLLELHRRRVDNFVYANVRYKIQFTYENELHIKKDIIFNEAYVGNILSSFVEQSCMDLVKKELKKGKIHKLIDVFISIYKNNIILTVRNNGFEVKNIHSLFLSDSDNKHILEAKNLATMLDAEVSINALKDEGMEYTCVFKTK
jgi:hypothetical protein